jgi:hypothetical protein
MIKKQLGQYYTRKNPFEHEAFYKWAKNSKLPKVKLLEPFAGSNHIINILQEMDLCDEHTSFDIMPTNSNVGYRDTIKHFPQNYSVCVTNPPWLAKNIATYKGLDFPQTKHDNLYKLCLELCLKNSQHLAILLPESFIRAGIFTERLSDFISITSSSIFQDTDSPVGLALFENKIVKDTRVWSNNDYIGDLSKLLNTKPIADKNTRVIFNREDGNVGLIALDNTKEASIRFCDVEELSDYKVKPTGRHITKIKVDGDVCIDSWNDAINIFRDKTKDILITSYKGLRKDGMYRRRCDWGLARGIINSYSGRTIL